MWGMTVSHKRRPLLDPHTYGEATLLRPQRSGEGTATTMGFSSLLVSRRHVGEGEQLRPEILRFGDG